MPAPRPRARSSNVDILWNGPSTETDYARQVQIVDSMIARQVDGLVVAAQDRTTLNASLDRAAAAHIPVTVFDSGVDSTNYMTYIATNNFQGGQMAARKLAALLNGKGTVAMLMHAPGSKSTMDREAGFEDVLQKEFPGIHIVARQFSMSDRAKAMACGREFPDGPAGPGRHVCLRRARFGGRRAGAEIARTGRQGQAGGV